ncbi:MAG: hypothetical protein JNK67_02090 [Alphaproteobacteria bacterium]|nr:hypothetical protein [Alphaproteobacteria bacterium]
MSGTGTWIVAALLALGVGTARMPAANAQSAPLAAAESATVALAAAVEIDARLLVALYHALSTDAAPASFDGGFLDGVRARGVAALRDGPYRLRRAVRAAAGADGLVLAPVDGVPGLQTTVDDKTYDLRIEMPGTPLLVPEAIAATLGERLRADDVTAVDLIIQLERVAADGEGRRVVASTLRRAIVLGARDNEPVHTIEASPMRASGDAPAAVAPPAPQAAPIAPPPSVTLPPTVTLVPVVPPPVVSPPVVPPPSVAAVAPPAAEQSGASPAAQQPGASPAAQQPGASPAATAPAAPSPPASGSTAETPSPATASPLPAPLPVTPVVPAGPPLVERVDAPMLVVAGGDVRASPQSTGALLFVVAPGTSIFVTGRVSAEWMQVRLIDGSLAYVLAAVFTAPPTANPIPATSNIAGAAPSAATGPTSTAGGQSAAVPVAPPPAFPAPPPVVPSAPAPVGTPVATAPPIPVVPPIGVAPTTPAPPPPSGTPPTPAPTVANPVAPASPAASPPSAVPAPPAAVPAPPAASPAPPAALPPPADALAEPVVVAERAGVLRNAASPRALQVAQVRPGQRFTLLQEPRGADGQIWAEVKPVDGAPGFILRKDLVTAAEWDAPVSGTVTRVIDAATLVVGTRTIRLGAVEAGPVRFLDIVRPWLTGAASPLNCERRSDAAFDCFSADKRDVGETMILNGLARAGAGAPAYYVEAQDKARQAKKGLWRSAR